MPPQDPQSNRLYGDLSHLWPIISPPHEYAKEARYWRNTLRKKLGPGRHHILELGVGGGHNLSHLTADFDATAVDISEGMLENSRRLNPGVEHVQGDMRTVRLGRAFDAVIIHDAIMYMTTEADLAAAFATARAHVRPGGVFITTPDWTAETFTGATVDSKTVRLLAEDEKTLKMEVTFIDYSYDPDPADSTAAAVFLYLIQEPGKPLRIEEDHHTWGLFPLRTWLRLIRAAGFTEVEKVPYPVHDDGHEGWLLVGRG